MSVICQWYDNVSKEQWWVPNIHGEEFQRVGRTKFIKSKMLIFSNTLLIKTRFSKNLLSLPTYNTFKVKK